MISFLFGQHHWHFVYEMYKVDRYSDTKMMFSMCLVRLSMASVSYQLSVDPRICGLPMGEVFLYSVFIWIRLSLGQNMLYRLCAFL